MKAFYLKNHTSPGLLEIPFEDLVQLPARPDTFLTKKDFLDWSHNGDTDHCFYNAWEPADPSTRLTKENPARFLHGLVADYDVMNLEQSAVERAIEDAAKAGFPVAYVSRTFSGGLRMVWALESPLPVFTAEVATGIAKRAMAELKLKKLAPGLDDGAFFDPSRYFEKGTEWRAVNPTATIPSSITTTWAFEASQRASFAKEGPTIPFEALTAEGQKRWQGRFPEPFAEGAMCVRWWDQTADNPKGAWIRKTGVQAFSGEAKFLTWADIFGKEWVKKYDEDRISSAVDGIYCDRTDYWMKDPAGLWKLNSADQLRRHFRYCGLQDAKKGECVGEVERALSFVERERRVDGTSAFLYSDRDIVELDGRRYLNKSHTRPIQPAGGTRYWSEGFPWIASLVDGLFVDGQRDTFLSWLSWAYQGALQHAPRQGHAIFMVGPTGTGKTLLSHQVISKLLGSRSEATNFLLGIDQFNSELLDRAVWTVDDAEIATDRQAHNTWSERLKKVVANRDQTMRGMYKEGVTMPWMGRVVVTLNEDAIAMLPNVDANLLEKVMFFQVEDPGILFDGCGAKIADELSNFAAFLRDWVIPEDLKDARNNRFGLRAYHHRELLDAARADTPSADVGYILQRWRTEYFTFEKDKPFWEGTSQELFGLLHETASLTQLLRHTIRTPNSLGKGLSTLIKQRTPGLSYRKSSDRFYRIDRPPGIKGAGNPGTAGEGTTSWTGRADRAGAICSTAQT